MSRKSDKFSTNFQAFENRPQLKVGASTGPSRQEEHFLSTQPSKSYCPLPMTRRPEQRRPIMPAMTPRMVMTARTAITGPIDRDPCGLCRLAGSHPWVVVVAAAGLVA
ncbi:hypothetical protein GH714_008185 [Hevea brasiliensis]|uniref:Uncharacterized protein n=1 Tax=Hevea brasiliensis TaxID=3981 RepID=A0A6A6M0F6_HEVBR|nr:hypothetical protein GH714_008185 [Hevea brasiliensis]